MLLPSDVARLVLGYLQEEGLLATSRAFIHESSNLKEYAEHTTADGTIPACVFSIFGKGLTSILNEYVAAKAKDAGHEVPPVMTSLWKKLDFTLNQIKSLQNSPAISASQRTRSRVGLANMARQRVLAVTSSVTACPSVSGTSALISPAVTSHTIMCHSTPQSRPSAIGAQQTVLNGTQLVNSLRDLPLQVVVSENRLNSSPISPGRRKWDTPRKRSVLSCSSGPSKSATTVTSMNAEAQPEEVADGNFPQLVIQNARDKILGDRSLQEKLAENINKILASDPAPQMSKTASSTVEADQSIDEILGLQGEIHMTDDAIHDILEQTESDPAFQALFDLFDYHKSRLPEGEEADYHASTSPKEADTVGPLFGAQIIQNNEPGPIQRVSSPAALNLPTKLKPGQERKNRKSTSSTMLKKTVLDSSGKSSRIENSSSRLLVSHGEERSASSSSVVNKRKEDIGDNDSLNAPPPPLCSLVNQEPLLKDSPSITGAFCKSTPVHSPKHSAPLTEESLISNGGKTPHLQKAQSPREHLSTGPNAASGDESGLLSSVEVQANKTVATTLNPPHSLSGGVSLQVPAPLFPHVSAPISLSPFPSVLCSHTSGGLTATSATSHPAPASSTSCGAVVQSPLTATQSKAGDSSNIVSLQIIVSDSQDVESSGDAALNRAISSISGDKIPTIFLSSPAKSPACPATPRANYDETAQAVSGLQNSEGCASPLVGKAGAVNSSPASAPSQTPQSYIIQLPMEASNPNLKGSPTSYFLVTPSTDVQTGSLMQPAGLLNRPSLPTNKHVVTTATYPQNFSTGSALILPSPVKPVVLPVSVLGQNTLGNVQVLSNKNVDIANTVPAQQKEAMEPQSTVTVTKTSTTSGTEKNAASLVVPPEKTGQLDAAKGSTHRRILCFDSSSSVQSQTAKTPKPLTLTATGTSPSQCDQQAEKDKRQKNSRTKPAILGGNKPKRRIETIRCSPQSQSEAGSLQTQQKEPVKRNSRKQVHNIHNKQPQNATMNSVSHQGDKSLQSVEKTEGHDAQTSKTLPCDSSTKSLNRKENNFKETLEKTARQGRTENKTPPQETPNVTANKENEIKQSAAPSSSESRDFSPPAVAQPKAIKAPTKTSSLAKQAAEMLQDIHGLNSAPVRKSGAACSDTMLPGIGRPHEGSSDGPRTPSCQRKAKNTEGTPKRLKLQGTPDVLNCSPASEAGSESSINMAAHTLMILSRAAIARTGTPLKDSLRQEDAGEKCPSSLKSPKSKKRKISSTTDSPPSKKECKRSPTAKKDKDRKKLHDGFPHDLDVDKFLSSLHYDE